MKRIVDLLLSSIALIVFAVPMLLIGIAILWVDGRPVLYWSIRVGQYNAHFQMPKFRTMCRGTPAVATHLLTNAAIHTTAIGRMLRRTSLDELPQLWSIFRGDMSIVGPRPALFNQYDLIEARTNVGLQVLVPGLTGLAQVSGRDELSVSDKVACDLRYLKMKSLAVDLRIVLHTIIKVWRREGVSH